MLFKRYRNFVLFFLYTFQFQQSFLVINILENNYWKWQKMFSKIFYWKRQWVFDEEMWRFFSCVFRLGFCYSTFFRVFFSRFFLKLTLIFERTFQWRRIILGIFDFMVISNRNKYRNLSNLWLKKVKFFFGKFVEKKKLNYVINNIILFFVFYITFYEMISKFGMIS